MKLQEAINICEEIRENEEKIPTKYDADYLQSKIDAFTEARKKDGKTVDDFLNECRGGLLELTWQDVKRIVEIADETLEAALYRMKSEEEYYSEILKRFKEDGE